MINERGNSKGMKISFIKKLPSFSIPRSSPVMFSKQIVAHYARFEVLVAVTMNRTLFWNVTPCNLVKIYRHFGGMQRFFLQGRRVTSLQRVFNEHRSGTLFRKVSKFILDCTTSHPRVRKSIIADYSENQKKSKCRECRMSKKVKHAVVMVF
jgi:hypothetical protein